MYYTYKITLFTYSKKYCIDGSILKKGLVHDVVHDYLTIITDVFNHLSSPTIYCCHPNGLVTRATHITMGKFFSESAIKVN